MRFFVFVFEKSDVYIYKYFEVSIKIFLISDNNVLVVVYLLYNM